MKKYVLLLLLLVLLTGCGNAAAAQADRAIFEMPDRAGADEASSEEAAAPKVREGEEMVQVERATDEALAEAPVFHERQEGLATCILSETAITQAASTYGIGDGTTAALALEKINSTYAKVLTEQQRAGLLVFFFEGAGSSTDPGERRDAMCVVVQAGSVIYLSRNCSTIPDYPFLPWKNDGDVPTLKSGIYSFDTVNHGGYAALRVLGDKVVRFHTAGEYYEDVSFHQSIEIHRRATDAVSPENVHWANSVGCMLVGRAGTGSSDEYAGFIQAVGIVPPGSSGGARYQTQVGGLVIVDRSYGVDYLRAVGYPEEAIALIGA